MTSKIVQVTIRINDSKAGEIKTLFNNTLDATRTGALREKMLRAGLPI